MPNHLQKRDRTRDREKSNPGAFGFRYNDDDESEPGRRGADRVDPEMRLIFRVAAFRFFVADHPPPMNGHSRLGQRESQKSADRKERNEMVGNAIENEEQRAGAGGEIKDADGEDEATAGNGERPRQEAAFGDGPAETRKSDKACVGR